MPISILHEQSHHEQRSSRIKKFWNILSFQFTWWKYQSCTIWYKSVNVSCAWCQKLILCFTLLKNKLQWTLPFWDRVWARERENLKSTNKWEIFWFSSTLRQKSWPTHLEAMRESWGSVNKNKTVPELKISLMWSKIYKWWTQVVLRILLGWWNLTNRESISWLFLNPILIS